MGDEAGEAGGVNGRMTLEASAQIVYSECMALKKGERCLIVFDKKKKGIAQAFYDVAQTITEKVEALEIPEPKTNGQEPAKYIAEKMKDCDVLLLITSKSLSHTDARRNATKKHGVRAASMPGITEEMAWRTLAIDYKGLDEKGKKLQKLLRPGAKLHLTTPLGTDLTLTIGPEIFNDNGIYTKDGAFGNLPAGEAGFAPVEGTTSGILVINKSMAGVGKLVEPLKLNIKGGFVTGIAGGKQAGMLKTLLKKQRDSSVYNIAEFAVGTNPKAKVTGLTLEDEKVAGTIHMAIGDNTSYAGGTTPSPVHLDGVVGRPTVEVDGKPIIRDGRLL
ncbi:TPA: aminopeptidase [Candidatus Woesearchaeota archaeon]|nr:aminopeptidase [Candidatus Woesearchaeota archaeon]